MVPAAGAVVTARARPYLAIPADADAARHQARHDALADTPGIGEVGRVREARVAPPRERVALLAGQKVRVVVAPRQTARGAPLKVGADANGPVEAPVPRAFAILVGPRVEARPMATRGRAPAPAL